MHWKKPRNNQLPRHDYLTQPISAIFYIDYQQEDNLIHQKIKIVTPRENMQRYFLMDKYKLGREVDDWLQTIYVGDGENIFFIGKTVYKNITTITYRVDNPIELNLESISKPWLAIRPKFDSCEGCQHLAVVKSSPDKCLFFNEFLARHKKFCGEFEEWD